MTVISSELRIKLLEDATDKAPRVAAALEKVQKADAALKAALGKSDLTDRMQMSLQRLGASAAHVDDVSAAWTKFRTERGLAGTADAKWTKAQIDDVKRFEKLSLASTRVVMGMETAAAKDRIKLAAEEAREERRLNEQRLRDAVRGAERVRDEKRRIAEVEARDARRHAERLAHEQARTDNTVAGVAALYAAHRAAHAAAHVSELYGEFDKERRYGKVVMGLTDAQQQPLVDQAIHGSANSKFNDIDWLKAQRSLAARGYNRDQVMGFTPTADVLATDFDTGMENGVKLFEGAMLGFRKDVSTKAAAEASARRTADLEVKASKISGMDAEDLIQLLKAAPSAQQAHLSEEQLYAFGGALKKVNINGDEASTAFKALSKNLLHPTSEARTALAASGIDFGKYQKIGAVNEDGFASEVARSYGVKLKGNVRAGLHRIFTDPELMQDPAKFTPAVMRLLKRDLYGTDAKSMKSIAGLATRYRDASAESVDTQGLLKAIIAALAANPALGVALWGSKQGGRISAGLGETFLHLLDELDHHAEGFGQAVKDARMESFSGAKARLANQLDILTTQIGRSFDDGGRGGLLTGATDAAGRFVHVLGEVDPKLLRAGSEAVLLAGAFAALKSVDFLKGGFGIGRAAGKLDISAAALNTSAKLLDDAAIKLGASKGAVPPVAPGTPEPSANPKIEPGGKAPVAPKGTPAGFLKNGLKGIPKGIMLGAPEAIAFWLAQQAGEGAIATGINALPGGNGAATRDHLNDRGIGGTLHDLWYHVRGQDTPEEIAAKKDSATPIAPPKVSGSADLESDGDAEQIAGARAAGGPVVNGKTYLVGEHGPELFTAGAAGQVTNSAALLAAVRGRGGELTTADVQRILAASAARDDGTVKAVEASGRQLSRAVDGIARAIDRLDESDRIRAAIGAAGAESGGPSGGGGFGSGRRGFMARDGHFGGRRGFSARGHDGGDFATGGRGSAKSGQLARNAGPMMAAMQAQLIADGVAPEHAKAAAAALMGNVVQESGGDPNKVHDHGTGYGIYGARLGRRDKMLAWLAKNGYAKNDAAGQARYMAHEAMTDKAYARTAAALRAADQANLGSVTDTVAKNFESPAAATANYAGRRNNAAAAFGGDIGGGGGGGGAVDAVSGTVAERLATFKRMGVLSNQQCVELARRFVGDAGTVATWRPGDKAEAGTLKPGTPVATFLNARGQEVGRYADGTVGRPGAHLDHAAIFEGYVRDGAGKITGMKVAEQYAGSHGVHDKVYGFHNGRFGEGDGANYHAIKRADGSYLGGRNNPMTTPRGDPLVAGPPTDDPLGLRARRERRHDGEHPLMSSLGDGITPAVDNRHLRESVALLREIREHTHHINLAAAKHRAGSRTQVAGLDARLRGGFAHAGAGFG